MPLIKFLFLSLTLLFLTCNETNRSDTHFSLDVKSAAKTIQLQKPIAIYLQNPSNFSIDSVSYSIGGYRVYPIRDSISVSTIKPGKQVLQATVFYEGKYETLTKTLTILSATQPTRYTYKILNQYPHDRNAYTQGLEFYKDTLYESTGREGYSTLRKINYKTGAILASVPLDAMYFGEGITFLRDTLYLLTWRSGKGFIYNPTTLQLIKSFPYGKSKEGWGLCSDGEKLYKSDGTEKIWILNPETLAEEDFIQTVTNTDIFSKANELEYVNGKIYANSYQKEGIMIINPQNGVIEGIVDFRGLRQKVTQHPDLDVFNGIAYNPKTHTFFVTGKNWDVLFEVVIVEK